MSKPDDRDKTSNMPLDTFTSNLPEPAQPTLNPSEPAQRTFLGKSKRWWFWNFTIALVLVVVYNILWGAWAPRPLAEIVGPETEEGFFSKRPSPRQLCPIEDRECKYKASVEFDIKFNRSIHAVVAVAWLYWRDNKDLTCMVLFAWDPKGPRPRGLLYITDYARYFQAGSTYRLFSDFESLNTFSDRIILVQAIYVYKFDPTAQLLVDDPVKVWGGDACAEDLP